MKRIKRRMTLTTALAASVAVGACSGDPTDSPSPGEADGATTEVDLSPLRGVTVWGASTEARIFVGELDPDAPTGVAPDPGDPFASGIAEIALDNPVAQRPNQRDRLRPLEVVFESELFGRVGDIHVP